MLKTNGGTGLFNPRWCALLPVIALCCFAGFPASGAIVNIKLNAPLGADEDVADFKISPDGQWVVFRAGISSSGPVTESFDLFSAAIDGSLVVRLNALLPSDRTVLWDYKITPDSQRVLYRADQDEDEKIELYSVAIDGPTGSGVKLNGDLAPDGDVFEFVFSVPDNPAEARVLYRAQQDSSTRVDLYSVPVAGPADAGFRVNDLSQAGTTLSGLYPSPDGNWIVHKAQLSPSGVGLFCASATGQRTLVVRLNGAIIEGGTLYTFPVKVSPDSSRVVYRADQQTVGQNELYSVPIRGPANLGQKMNSPLPAGGDVKTFEISPDSQWVAYSADHEVDGKIALFAIPTAGAPGGGQRISHDLPPDYVVDTGNHQFSPESNRVVYRVFNNAALQEAGEIYSVPVAGPPSEAVRLNEPLVPGGSVGETFRVANGAGRVVYIADREVDGAFELYSVPIAGPAEANVKLNPSLGDEGDVILFELSPDGLQVAYRADRILIFFGDDVYRLWTRSVSLSRSPSILHGAPPVPGGDVLFDFAFTPDSGRVVYLADQDTDEVDELYVSYYQPAAARGWDEYK